MKTALLRSRGAVRVAGPDAGEWLQGLVTNDVDKADGDHACFAALLSPQGKVLFDFLITRQDSPDGAIFHLDCAAAQSAALAKRLSMYRLRSKVTVTDVSGDTGVLAIWADAGEEPPDRPAPEARRDPRHPLAGWRMVGPKASIALAAPPTENEAAYSAHRIANGVPEGGTDFSWADVFPHDVNMDELNGVDFRKGCYIGQEVVSRVQHRGNARKRVRPIVFEGAASAPGAAITAGGQTIGHVTSVSGSAGLGLVRIDKADEAQAADAAFVADGNPLRIDTGAKTT